MAEYPMNRGCKRIWANQVVRMMNKSCAANEIGPEGFTLVATIAMTEDAKRYSGAVTFYNGQLMPITGLRSEARLNNARRKSIKAGWLHYEPGTKSVPGRYWTQIPDHAGRFNDAPVDDGNGFLSECPSDFEGQTTRTKQESVENVESKLRTYKPNPSPLPAPEESAQSDDCTPLPPPELLTLIERWNILANLKLVPHKAKSEPPAKAVLKAWDRAQKSTELQTALVNVDGIEAAIRGSPFVHAAGWFRLEKLIAGTNKEGTYILTKLLEGGFADQASHRPSQQRNPNANRHGLSPAERTEQANAEALNGFLGTEDHEAGVRQSDDRAVLPEKNGGVHSSTTDRVVRCVERIPTADD